MMGFWQHLDARARAVGNTVIIDREHGGRRGRDAAVKEKQQAGEERGVVQPG